MRYTPKRVAIPSQFTKICQLREKNDFLLFQIQSWIFHIIFYFRVRIFNLTVAQKDSMLTSVSFHSSLQFNSDFYYKIFHLQVKTNVNINL